jgi:hypothetical protein
MFEQITMEIPQNFSDIFPTWAIVEEFILITFEAEKVSHLK